MRLVAIPAALGAEKQHNAGLPCDDRGDGLHWLVCCDCGEQWAENDDGSLAAGSGVCGHERIAAALAEVVAVENALTAAAALAEMSFGCLGQREFYRLREALAVVRSLTKGDTT
jgi:hypothetical protein